jgi:leucyl-tRNA synthetase
VQVNGKVRDRLQVPADIAEERAKELALASQRVRAHIDNKDVQRVIYVPGKLVNVVVR